MSRNSAEEICFSNSNVTQIDNGITITILEPRPTGMKVQKIKDNQSAVWDGAESSSRLS